MEIKLILILITSMRMQLIDFEDLSKNDKQLYNQFKNKFKKSYKDKDDEYRFQIFAKNLRLIKDEPEFSTPDGKTLLGNSLNLNNRKKMRRYKKDINIFIDLTDQEFSSFYLLPYESLYRSTSSQNKGISGNTPLLRKNKKRRGGRFLQEENVIQNLPKQIDWKDKLTPIKFQSRCNSCYVFSALAAIEAHHIIYNEQKETLSEQEILDCNFTNYACIGGQPSEVYAYVLENFLSFDRDYPYIGKKNDICYKDYEIIPTLKTEEGRNLQEQFFDWNKRNIVDNIFDNNRNLQDNSFKNNFDWNKRTIVDNMFDNNRKDDNKGKKNLKKPKIVIKDKPNGKKKVVLKIQKNKNVLLPVENSSLNVNYPKTDNINTTTNPINYNTLVNPNIPNQNIFPNNTNFNNPQNPNIINYNNLNQQNPKPFDNTIPVNNINNTIPWNNYNNTIPVNNNNNTIPVNNNNNTIPLNNNNNTIPVNNNNNTIPINNNNNTIPVNNNNNTIPLNNNNNTIPVNNSNNTIPVNNNQINNNANTNITPVNNQTGLKRRKFKNLKTYKFINQNVVDLLKELENGPVVVAHFASSPFKFYSSGIFDGEGCENIKYANHSSILIGYNLSAEIPYMEFKNSWGENWGDKGFYKMAIGDLLYTNKGLCLVAGTPFNVSPVLED